MLPLRAGVRDPPLHPLLHPLLDLLPDPLPAVPKLQFERPRDPHFLCMGRRGAEQQPQRCRQLIFYSWPGSASVSPTLKSPCASVTGSGRTHPGVARVGTRCQWG